MEEFMPLCDYGCGQEATHYSSKVKKHCCVKHPRGCPAYKLVMAERTRKQMDAATGLTSEQRAEGDKARRAQRQKDRVARGKAETPPDGQICEYGCGQPARFHLRPLVKDEQGTRFVWRWCCSSHYRGCPNAKATARVKQKTTTLERLGYENHQQSPQSQAAYRATCLKRYGVDYAPQAPAVKAQRAATNLERYGNRGAMSPEVLRKKLETVRERYGVDNVFQASEIQARAQATILARFGATSHMKLTSYRELLRRRYWEKDEQRQATCIQRYGVAFHLQAESVQEKGKETSLRKYGVRHYRQHGPTFRKIKKGMFGFKDHILPSGAVIKLQGYEPLVVDLLLKDRDEAALDFINIPSFPYKDSLEREHVYHPDLYLPGENLIIEVKSWWTLKDNYEINRRKQASVLTAGYRFQFWVKDDRQAMFDIIEDPLPDFPPLQQT